MLAADLRGVVMQGAIPSIEIDLGSEELDAPVIRGTPLGVARLISGGEVIAEVPLVADADVPRDDFPAHWRRIWENWLMVENGACHEWGVTGAFLVCGISSAIMLHFALRDTPSAPA